MEELYSTKVRIVGEAWILHVLPRQGSLPAPLHQPGSATNLVAQVLCCFPPRVFAEVNLQLLLHPNPRPTTLPCLALSLGRAESSNPISWTFW